MDSVDRPCIHCIENKFDFDFVLTDIHVLIIEYKGLKLNMHRVQGIKIEHASKNFKHEKQNGIM